MSDRRQAEVITFPQPIRGVDRSVVEALETLKASVGFVTSLLVVALHLNHTGTAVVAASGGTALVGGNATLDLEDARITQLRLEGYGGSTGSGDSVRVKLGSTVLCSVALATSPARFTSAWTVVALPSGDQTYSVEVVGNGARTQTIHRVALHGRTI